MWPFPDLPVQNGRKPRWLNVAIVPDHLVVYSCANSTQPQNVIKYVEVVKQCCVHCAILL